MSRRKTLPSLSSSRQMMMAWKVSGLSHRPAIIASRPASMRLAMAISPSRDSSSTEPISRRYMRTGSSVRSARLLGLGFGRDLLLDLDQLAALALGLLLGVLALLLPLVARLLGFDHVDAHLAEHRENVLDLLGGDLLRGQHRVDLIVGDVAALLGGADQLLDGRVGEVEQRQRGVGRFGGFLLRAPRPSFFSFCAGSCSCSPYILSWHARPDGVNRRSRQTLPYAGRIDRPKAGPPCPATRRGPPALIRTAGVSPGPA